MRGKLVYAAVVVVSFCLAVGLGMLDHEAKSLVHLFTAELGNFVALLIYTVAFSLVGCSLVAVVRAVVRDRHLSA